MATANQGTKFRRVSSNKNHARSASTGNILSSSPPTYPEVITYNTLLQSAGSKGHSKVHRISSSSQGGSFNPLQGDGVVGYSAYSINGATSLDSVNPTDYDRGPGTRPVSYTHPHSEGQTRPREARAGSTGPSERRGRPVAHLAPSHHAMFDSSRESFQSNRELYNRHSHLRDSMSQDTMGEREFDYQLRYNANASTTLPTLSLQDSYHTRDHTRVPNRRRGKERAMSESNDRDLRRGVQEFEVMPVHEVFSHRIMMASGGSPTLPAHLSPQSPHQTSPPANNVGRSGSGGGGAPAIIDRQPRTSSVEPEHKSDVQDGLSSGTQQQTYLPVFYSPETGQFFMSIDGDYKPLQNQIFTDSVSLQRGPNFNQSDQRYSMTELSGRQTSSSYGMTAPYDYFHCSIVMMIIYIMCLNVVVVLACSLPALWFSRKAMKAKYEGDYAGTLSLGTKALCFNIIGGCVHILFLCALTFIPIMLRFVFNAI